jgi:DNA-directed RNA polymerase subunit RPC12/RpoP
MTSRKWIDAAIVLGKDPDAKVQCPVCGIAELTVRDVFPTPDADVLERYLECSNCAARNIMRKRR